MSILQEKIDERAKLMADAQAMHDKADAEKRTMTKEEGDQFDKMVDDAQNLSPDIQRRERTEQFAREEKAKPERRTSPENPEDESRSPGGKKPEDETEKRNFADEDEFRANKRLNERMLWSDRATVDYRDKFARYMARGRSGVSQDEFRALQADSSETGGYTYADEQFVARLIQAVDDAVHIRQFATVHTVKNADTLGFPSLDADPDDGDWTSELLTGSLDGTMDFGKRELKPYAVAKRIKVSNKLLRMSALGIENLVRTRFAYKFAITEEKAFLTGNGSQRPLGLFTASSNGISTGRDVSTGNTSTEIRFDGLIEAKYTLKAAYWPRARWLFHRDAVKQIAKLKDGEGQYLWRESVRAGEASSILGLPAIINENAPNTFTTQLYAGLLGDLSWYWIADALSFQLKRADELYMETDQVGFFARKETDGMPVLEEAFVRVKLA